MKQRWIILFVILFPILGLTQKRVAPLPKELLESSALVKYKCNFITLNDSGNEPELYVFNKKGEITHICFIKNVKNIDWEALAYDGQEYLYIGDIGNNENKRQDLAIHKVKLVDVLVKDTVNVETILFSYPEQYLFPPYQSELYYDAEALIVKEGQLLIFTKNRTVPFDGISKVYALPTVPGEYQAELLYDLNLLPTTWREECITDAFLYKDELYLLTYAKVYMYSWDGEKWIQQKEYLHDSWTQKEGIAVDRRHIYITDENATQIFSNNYLYKLRK